LLRHLQQPANSPYPGPHQSSPCTHIPLPANPFYHYLPIYAKSHVCFPLLTSCQRFSPIPMPCKTFRNIVTFCSEQLLASRPTPNLEDHPLSAVYNCLFSILATMLHMWRSFLHPQPEDALHRGDRNPLITERKGNYL
jgi:hypothetical protein